MKNKMLIKVMLAIALAVIAGLITGATGQIGGVPFVEIYGLIGQLFLNALTLVVVPLVASSIITGSARMGGESSFGTLGLKTFGYYIGTSFLAVLVGLACALLLAPGVSEEKSAQAIALIESARIPEIAAQVPSLTEVDTFHKIGQILLKIVPPNIFAAAAQGQMLGLIFFSLLFGFFLSKIEAQPAALLLGFWQGIFQVMMAITHFVMRALPIGVFGLVAKVVATTGMDSLGAVAFYFVTVLVGLFAYSCIVLPLLLKFIGGVSPLLHLRAISPALLTAFSTSSSAATLPITMDCMEKRAGVSNRICSFVIPLGTSLNMSGSALYQCVATIFIAQVYGIDLSIPTLSIVVIMSLLTSIGMAGIPSASLLGLMVILHTIGLPADGIGLILAVERILDMFRTTINVLGNTCCAVLVARSEGETEVLSKGIEQPLQRAG